MRSDILILKASFSHLGCYLHFYFNFFRKLKRESMLTQGVFSTLLFSALSIFFWECLPSSCWLSNLVNFTNQFLLGSSVSFKWRYWWSLCHPFNSRSDDCLLQRYRQCFAAQLYLELVHSIREKNKTFVYGKLYRIAILSHVFQILICVEGFKK